MAIGGFGLYNVPVALVRALVRAGRRGLTVVAPFGSIAPDLLVGAGCAASVACVSLGFEHLGDAPAFRRAAEAGEVSVVDFDLAGMAAALRAAAQSVPWLPVHDTGSDIARINPGWYAPLPATDRAAPGRLLTVRALIPDVTLLHAQQGDYGGNCQFWGATFWDALLAQAGRKVFVSVDEQINYDQLRKAPASTKVPEFINDGVVHLPYGAHPTGSHGRYDRDDSHLGYYLDVAASASDLATYVRMFVTGLATHDAYLAAIGRPALRDLHR